MSESSHNVELKNISRLREHELSAIVPDMRPEEWSAFVSDIKERRIQVPLEITKDGTVLDGRHRLRAARQLGITRVPAHVVHLNGTSPEEYMVKAALLRRHLSDDQRAALALRWRERESKKAVADGGKKSGRSRSNEYQDTLVNVAKVSPRDTRVEAAGLFAVPEYLVRSAAEVQARAPELMSSVESGDLSLRDAKKKIRDKQLEDQRQALKNGKVNLPKGKFEVIVIDPPWPYGTEYDPAGRRAANPYPEMSLEEIGALRLPAADDCILWFWTTHKFMRHSFDIIDRWGFRDVSIVTWVKDKMGLGTWLRSQTEFCIMAVKGHPKVDLKDQTTVIYGPMREHSRKPDEFYKMVEGLCIGRKVDWFSREARDGWEQAGLEVEKFND